MQERKKSVINSKFRFNQAIWIVSVLNTDGRWFGLPGHSVVVVEGKGLESIKQQKAENNKSKIKDEEIKYNLEMGDFVRMCDIQSELFPGEKSSYLNNVKGYMSEIRIYDTHRVSYDNLPSKSYYAEPQKVVEMLQSILDDKRKVRNYKEGKGEPLLFQRWGKESFFADSKEGDSCAGWCIEKLAIAGIGDGTDKPKPKLMVGCTLF